MKNYYNNFTEADIRSKFILPAIKNSGWNEMKQIREEFYFTDGRIIIQGKTTKRGDRNRADFLLNYKLNFPLAIVEAKDGKHTIGDGMQQAIKYAKILDIPFAYSSNGEGFLEHDMLTGKETELTLNQFPNPEELYQRYKQARNINSEKEEIIKTPYFSDDPRKQARYYQQVAINRTVEAVASGQKRAMLVMATGTGKTYTAGQIIYRLWKARKCKRILFLADRNILVDQTMSNDFKPLFKDKMTKIKNRQIDKSYEIYLALYQGLTGNEEDKNAYKEFSPDFFDLVVVDECHRGSVNEDSAWREVLNYFSSAIHIGLTATPKETDLASNIEYFGEPIYTYSLKQGIEDGFLAPYRVIQIMMDKDIGGYRPNINDRDRDGNIVEDKIYTSKDFDRKLILTERTKSVAREITNFLKNIQDRYAKTIVFCIDIDHAERMRQALNNENSDLATQNPKYVMRITGDNMEGKMELDNFIDPESKYPVIVTTSKLMTTGVDAKTCKLIVLDSNINSMTEFKQIIGRGTRLREDYGKTHFTILDFRKATELFADPDFDGEAEMIKQIQEGEDISFDEEDNLENSELKEYQLDNSQVDFLNEPKPEYQRQSKIIIDGVPVIKIFEQTQYIDENGKLVSESIKDFSRKLILKRFDSLDKFLTEWNETDRKSAIVEALKTEGLDFETLQKTIGVELDAFDLITHIAFGQNKLKTRAERAKGVRKKDYFNKYSQKAKQVLLTLLTKYEDEGIDQLEDIKILQINPFTEFGTVSEILSEFGSREKYFEAIKEMEREIYQVS